MSERIKMKTGLPLILSMVGQEREYEGTELKRPALLWFAAYILVLPVSTLGIGSLTGFMFTSLLLLVDHFF